MLRYVIWSVSILCSERLESVEIIQQAFVLFWYIEKYHLFCATFKFLVYNFEQVNKKKYFVYTKFTTFLHVIVLKCLFFNLIFCHSFGACWIFFHFVIMSKLFCIVLRSLYLQNFKSLTILCLFVFSLFFICVTELQNYISNHRFFTSFLTYKGLGQTRLHCFLTYIKNQQLERR